MVSCDKFGNVVRSITDLEKRDYLPVIRKRIIQGCIVTVVYTILVVALACWLMADAPSYSTATLLIAALFVGSSVFLIIYSGIELHCVMAEDIGVIRIHSDDVQTDHSKSKKPRYYIRATDTITGKEICYSITKEEYLAFSENFGHLKEIDYIIVNPRKIKYSNHLYFFKLLNSGTPVMETAVYDNIDKNINMDNPLESYVFGLRHNSDK